MPLLQSKLFLWIETFYLVIFPLLLIYRTPDLIHWRLPVMLVSLIYISLMMKIFNLSPKRIGLSRANFFPALRNLALPTLIGVIFLLIGNFFNSSIWHIKAIAEEVDKNNIFFAILIYAAISAPLQELIFRGFYLSRLELLSGNKNFLIWYSAIVFAAIHLPLGNWKITLASLFIGLIYASNFLRYRNVLAVSISHALLGSLMIRLII